jgi:putative oxidoreductase
MFPNGWPGSALLLLRLVSGILLIHDAIAALQKAPVWTELLLHLVTLTAGLLLLIGLWTPMAGTLVAAAEAWIAFSQEGTVRDSVILATLGAALSMLGPGVRSIDALLYGRKRIDIRGL